MIDQKVFLEEMGILMDWFNRDFEVRFVSEKSIER